MDAIDTDSTSPEDTRPFRILDLPPELRNTIFEFAFAEEAGLAPHAITRTNQQLRKESLDLFYDERATISVEVRTPKQMTCLLNWLSFSDSKDTDKVRTITFNYDHPRHGACQIVLHRAIIRPALILRTVMAELHKDEHSTATQDMRNTDVGFAFWRASNGIPNFPLISWNCYTYDSDLAEPPQAFWDAVMNGEEWVSYRMEILDNVTQRRCFCNPDLKRFAGMLRDLQGAGWQQKMRELRKLASALYSTSLRAEAQRVKIKVEEVEG